MGVERVIDERSLRNLLDNVPVGLYRSSPEGKLLYANPALATMLGYQNVAEIQAMSTRSHWFDLSDRERWAKILLRDGVVNDFEMRLRKADGSPLWVRNSTSCVESGNRLYYDGAMRDISARKHAEEALERSLSLQLATLESTTDGLLVVDQEGKIVSYNRRFAELWNISDEVLESRDDERALAAVLDQLVDPEAFLAKVRELYDRHDAESEDVLEFRDGRVFERYSRPQRISGRSIGRVWSFRDVTDSRRLEDQLRQSQKLEAVGRLAGGVAHDFNNLLTAILGHSALLVQELENRPSQHGRAEEIHEAALRAASLTRQLLAFSRKQVLEPRVIDLNETVKVSEKLIRRLIGEHIRVTTSFEEQLGLVRADPGQIEQVILNLSVNARDAMPNGGELRIETRNAFVPGHDDLGWHSVISVIDSGSGIDPSIRERLFEPFFTTKEAGKGTGLGLSTAYGIVRQSCGEITVESEPGQGARFDVYLPHDHSSSATDVTEIENARAQRGSETILLVEDDGAVRSLLSNYLASLDYGVIEASTGQEALAVVEERGHQIDVVLSDMVMPKMSGAELTSILRSDWPDIHVILMSGYRGDSIESRVEDQRTPYLQKPFTLDQLAATIRFVLEDQSEDSSGISSE